MKMFPLPEEVKGWGGFYKSQCKSRDKYYLLFEEKALEVPTVQRGGRGGGGKENRLKPNDRESGGTNVHFLLSLS